MPLFSVVIPTHNRAALLIEALNSVLAQEFTDFEVIVVDDASTDSTETLLADYESRIRFLRRAVNGGPGAARNTGIQHARGKYVAFLDSDDIWFPWTLASYAETIEKCHGPAMVVGHSVPLSIRQSLELNKARGTRFKYYKDFLEASRRHYAFAGTPGVAVRTEWLRSAGGFIEDFVNGEDQDLCLRLGAASGFVRIEAPPVFSQRTHSEHVSKNLERSLAGAHILLRREKEGGYPGGPGGRRVRRRIVTAMACAVSIHAAATGRITDAAELYWDSFIWNIQLGRLKYVCGFPVLLLRNRLKTGIA